MSEFCDNAIKVEFSKDKGTYTNIKTQKLLDDSRVKRIKSLGIPPMYKDIWLAKNKDNKIQAVALDSKQRKQYFYSKRWTRERELQKKDRLKEFLEIVPKIRIATRANKLQKSWKKTKTMAYMLDIVMETNIRVGNKKYMQANNSFGLTTLQKKHLCIKNGVAILNFRGKHGVQQIITIKHKPLIKFLETMKKLPEDWLMKYKSSDNNWYRVSAQDLNNYLHSIVGPNLSIKDYRTWGGNILFVETLSKLPIPDTKSTINKNISLALDCTAEKLGNTKATSKKSYVMDSLIDEYKKNPKKIIHLGMSII